MAETDPKPEDLRALAHEYCRETRRIQTKAHRLAKRHRTVYFAVAIAAVLAGVVAGVGGLAERSPALIAIAGFTASALAAVAPTLDAKRLASFHFTQAAEYGAIGSLFEILAIDEAEPTATQVKELVERMRRCRSGVVSGDVSIEGED